MMDLRAQISSALDREIVSMTSLRGGDVAAADGSGSALSQKEFFAAAAFLAAAVLVGPWSRGRTLAYLGTLGAAALLAFGTLLAVATQVRVERVDVPAQAVVTELLEADYADAFRVRIPPGARHDVNSVARIVVASMRPCYLEVPSERLLRSVTFEPGTSAGQWPVFYRSANEIVLGLDRSYIDLRLSVMVSEAEGSRWVTVSTVARYNDWRGLLYFVPVRFGHQIVLADTMRKTAAALR